MPLTVNVNAAVPAWAEAGFKLAIVGVGLLTAKVRALDKPPPGAGFSTVMGTVRAVAMSPAPMTTVSCVALTKVVWRVSPLKRTTELLMKFVPVTVIVKFAPPAEIEFGFNAVSVGTGLPVVMLKGRAFDAPPPGAGFNTVICAVPALAMSAAVICAVSCVALTNVVARF